MGTGLRTSRLLSACVVVVACGAATGAVGCRTTTDDVHRWADRQNGPKKLEAVVKHDKYDLTLRTEAALTLITMEPRKGRRIGLEGGDDPEQRGVMRALASVPKETRGKIIEQLVPQLEAGMKKPSELVGKRPTDVTFSYKDGAFALLNYEKGSLIPSEAVRLRLSEALASWVAADFSSRMDESSQTYSVDQVISYLKAAGVRQLPRLLAADAPKLERLAQFLAEYGDPPTKLVASTQLVTVAQYVTSPRWRQEKTSVLEKSNRESKLTPTAKQFEGQLEQYQEEEILRLFSSMKRVGGAPIVTYLLGYTADKANSDKRRTAAVAALEGNLDKNDAKQVDAMFALAGADDSPDSVRDLALRRLGDMPRKGVIDRLYGLFAHKNWKVRWLAAELALKMSDTDQVSEFMTKLGAIQDMALSEPMRYGSVLADVKGSAKSSDLAAKFLSAQYPAPVRLTALGWYFYNGTSKDLDSLRNLSEDKMAAPKCAKDAKDCEWKCEVSENGKVESKDIATVGAFAKYCVLPELERRSAASAPKK